MTNTHTAIAGLITITGLMMPGIVNANPAPDLIQQTETVATYLEGVMSTSAQAKANSKSPEVQMTTCRITLTENSLKVGEIAMYQEQALLKSLTQPYRQRFLLLSPNATSQSVRSLSYRPPHPERWAGLCSKPIAARMIPSAELGSHVCSVFLRQVGETFRGNTPIGGCPTNARGAVRTTNHIILRQTGMETWDRGYDASGKQVWGATGASYQYQKQ